MKGNHSHTKVHSNRNAAKLSSTFKSRKGNEKPRGDISDEESLDGSQSDLSYEESIDLDSSQQQPEADTEEEAGEEESEQPRPQSKERSSRKKPPPMPTTIEGLDARITELKRRQETLSLLKNKQHRRTLFENIRHQIIKVLFVRSL